MFFIKSKCQIKSVKLRYDVICWTILQLNPSRIFREIAFLSNFHQKKAPKALLGLMGFYSASYPLI